MAHPKVEKTNAARLLDRAKIAYELVPYRVWVRINPDNHLIIRVFPFYRAY